MSATPRATVFTDPEALADHLMRENDAIAAMASAEAGRVDQIASQVGLLQGEISSARKDIHALNVSVQTLTSSMNQLVRHEMQIQHERQLAEADRRTMAQIDQRLRVIEVVMPGVLEVRKWVIGAVVFVATAVGVALLSLVVTVAK